MIRIIEIGKYKTPERGEMKSLPLRRILENRSLKVELLGRSIAWFNTETFLIVGRKQVH